MLTIESFTFNPFQENTYVVYHSENDGVIIDPGCHEQHEKDTLSNFISNHKITPKHLLNTHCHIDHVLGNYFISKEYNLVLEAHKDDIATLNMVGDSAHVFGFSNYEQSPDPSVFLTEGDQIKIGTSTLDILFTPGHAPGHIVFVNHEQKFVIGGDVLFQRSIGRTDLPGGDHPTLIKSIKEKLFTLADDYEIYPGHGPKTTIGFEKQNNPFLT